MYIYTFYYIYFLSLLLSSLHTHVLFLFRVVVVHFTILAVRPSVCPSVVFFLQDYCRCVGIDSQVVVLDVFVKVLCGPKWQVIHPSDRRYPLPPSPTHPTTHLTPQRHVTLRDGV